MSKRSKFVLVTWVGPNVSVMKKAKMSTDKALMKEVIQVSLNKDIRTFNVKSNCNPFKTSERFETED